MLLVLDNMQWCDQETLAFLTFFLGLAPDVPVLVAATLRNDTHDDDPELADWTVRMRATGLFTELSLSPLDPPTPSGSPRRSPASRCLQTDANLLQAATGGFPLYIVEAVRGNVDLAAAPAGGDLDGGAA